MGDNHHQRKEPLMGLDNYPRVLPCEAQGTAVTYELKVGDETILDDDGKPVTRIHCEDTIDNGGCPWFEANPPEEGRVLGMFGAPCWYRGKYGNALIEQYVGYDESSHISFYGDNHDGTEKSAASCATLAEAINNAITDTDTENGWFEQEDRAGLVYAAWYSNWAAENTDGLRCWY